MATVYTINTFDHGCCGRKHKNAQEAIIQGSWDVWPEQRIKKCFNFANGTMKDLKRFCKDNHSQIYEENEFTSLLDTIPEKHKRKSNIPNRSMLTKDAMKCKITHSSYEYTISQLLDGDMLIEYGTQNLWVLATFDHRNGNYHIQENLDNGEIIDIKDTHSLPDALTTMTLYIHSHKNK